MPRLSLSAPLVVVTALALPATAYANDVAFTLQPALAIPIDAPQSRIFDDGAAQSIGALFGVTPYLDVGPTVGVLVLPAATDGAEAGTAWGFGGGARLKRPHDAITYRGVSPWLDLDALYVRTGSLNRPGFAAAIGVAVPLGDERRFWIGPFVRYMQTIQPARAGFDNTDAKVVMIGVSLEVGAGRARTAAPVPEVVPAPEPAVAAAPVEPWPDRDQDGISDAVDHCPDVTGLMDDYGCPAYAKVVVKKDKLELKEKLYFAWDQATLEDASFPVLDDVVQALKDSPDFRVQVEGHSDSSGADDHNQTLSQQRADAVLDYLVTHGIAKDRLVSKGFSSSVPIDTNDTVAGRENNRRVEFVVNFIILDTDGGK